MLELVRRLLSKPAPAPDARQTLVVRTAVQAGWTTTPTTTTTSNHTMGKYYGANGVGYVPISRAVANLLDAQARRAGRLYARLRRA